MQRTKSALKDQNIIHWIVERNFPPSRKYPKGCKEDFLHIIDLIALDNGVVGVQVCGTDWTPHVSKIIGKYAHNTTAWLQQPGTRLELWGWRKVKKKKGGKLMVWKPRIADILLMGHELYLEERKEGGTHD
jgi:hypothetical protein